MLCYKDKTWCVLKDCRHWNSCPEALTEDVIYAAIGWWGDDDAPIMQSDEFKCFEPKLEIPADGG